MAIEKREEQVATTAIITPAKADEVLEMIEAFEYFKQKVLTENDKVDIQGKPFVKKSGWSKYALACNVSTEVREERVEERDGHRIYHFTYRAIHLPSGRYAEAVGSASEAEKTKWNHPEHDVRTLAQTRAFNRCISNLVGGGEVSAEEMKAPPSREQRKEVKAEPVREKRRRPTPSPGLRKRTVKEPSRRTQLQLGRVDLNVIKTNLDALDVVDDVDVWEQDDGFYVRPSKNLTDEDYNRVNETLDDMGAEWQDDSQRWVIWREVE